MLDYNNRKFLLTVNGKKIETAWHGPEPDEAPTLVFLHEGLGCVSMWRDFPSRLAKKTGCGALVYSRIGYGGSDPCELPRPVRFMHDEGLEELPMLLKVAGIRECVIIGHSDGGSIGIIYAGGTQAKVLKGLITEAAHVFCEKLTLRSIKKAKENFLEGSLRKNLERYHGANTDGAFWGWNEAWLHQDFPKWNIEPYLPGIKVPLLAIQGQEDQYGTTAQIEAIVKGVPKAEMLLLPGCGHSPHREAQGIILKAMSGFIGRLFG